MKLYKRGIFSLVKSIFVALFAPVALFFVLSIFTDNALIMYSICAAALLWLLYTGIFNENIKFEISEDGILNYYVRNNLKNTFELKKCTIGYKCKSTNGDADNISLQIITKDIEEFIDCTPLGMTKFYKMYAEIEQYTNKQDKKIKLKTKGEE